VTGFLAAMKFRRYSDGIRIGETFGLRWRSGVCAPERRRHVILLSLGSQIGRSMLFAVQVWRASASIEVMW
jgi:hypothetical protein